MSGLSPLQTCKPTGGGYNNVDGSKFCSSRTTRLTVWWLIQDWKYCDLIAETNFCVTAYGSGVALRLDLMLRTPRQSRPTSMYHFCYRLHGVMKYSMETVYWRPDCADVACHVHDMSWVRSRVVVCPLQSGIVQRRIERQILRNGLLLNFSRKISTQIRSGPPLQTFQ